MARPNRNDRRDPLLAEAIARIVDEFRPWRVYLFGSRAWGRASRDSDYDLLVVIDGDVDERRTQGRIAVSLWGLAGAFDVIVRSRAWWEAWSDTPCSLEEQIATEGVILHDAA